MAFNMRHIARRWFGKRNFSIGPKKTPTTYIEAMYYAWLNDPSSVHKSWDTYFRSCPVSESAVVAPDSGSFFSRNKRVQKGSSAIDAIDAHAAVHALIKKYQEKGYSIARLCPLETNQSHYPAKELHQEFNFLPQDWEHEFRLPPSTHIGSKEERTLILKEIIKRLELVYCNKIGIDYMFLDSVEQRNWIREKFESSMVVNHSPEERHRMLGGLSRTFVFERFLNSHFPSYQDASLSGCEVLAPALKKLIDISSSLGARSFVMGLPQRGRLSILATVCKKSLREILSLFNSANGDCDDDLGDLKYSLGAVIERWNWTTNKEVRLSVMPNANHFETLIPVVLGKTRAEQVQRGDDNMGCEVMAIIVHDDASFNGQGIAYETAPLSTMPHYTTHGTIHVVMNTLDNFYSPSSNQSANSLNPLAMQYCKSISRALDAPLFHVNADDPDAVMQVCKIAGEWRSLFHKDVIIDLVGYRRYPVGHKNSLATLVDPILSTKIAEHRTCLDTYAEKLIADQVLTADEIKTDTHNFEEVCQTALDLAKLMPSDEVYWNDGNWTKNSKPSNEIAQTGVKMGTLKEFGHKFLSPPGNEPNFVLSKSLHKILLERQDMLDRGTADWTIAEALAFATLLKDRIHVRLSVQATERDAFSKRHHIYHHHFIPGKTYCPLEHVHPKQAPYVISYTALSESAVLGFEHGYSMANPNVLVLWEANFGDLASSTQSIIDNYITTGQFKWGVQSGLVMLLSHDTWEEANPNSSPRLERFLQMNSDDPITFLQNTDIGMLNQLQDVNFIVANCTTPANYFHILRRQLVLPFRKPLILMVSPSLVEHGAIKSSFEDMNEQSEFQPLISQQIQEEWSATNFRRVIFCSGRIYYDLIKARAEKELDDEIAIVRIEQLAPFPYEFIRSEVDTFEHADLVWVQEEHKNHGAWSYVQPRFQAAIFDKREVNYVGRGCSGLAANISRSQRNREHDAIVEEALSIPTDFVEKCW